MRTARLYYMFKHEHLISVLYAKFNALNSKHMFLLSYQIQSYDFRALNATFQALRNLININHF